MDFFAKSTQWLGEKAGAASIDWAALAANRQDSVYSTAYMDQYLLPAFTRCSAVIDTLDLDRSNNSATIANYFNIDGELSDLADGMLKVTGVSIEIANPLMWPKLQVQSYQQIIWYMWAMALTGANMHLTAQIHKSGIPDADIAYHASLVTMMFNVISRLDAFGLLKPIKKNSANGLGAVPLLAIIVLGAIAIIALAWAIVAIFEISQRNEVVKAACVKATDSGDPEAIVNCQKLFSSPEGDIAGQIPKSLSKLASELGMIAMIGAGIYLAIQFGPGIATKMKQSVSAWKAA